MTAEVPARISRGVKARDRHRCIYCRSAVSGAGETLDHVIPESWFIDPMSPTTGDPHAAGNLVTCCMYCNGLKRDMDLETFAMYMHRRYGTDSRPMVRRVRAALARSLPLENDP